MKTLIKNFTILIMLCNIICTKGMGPGFSQQAPAFRPATAINQIAANHTHVATPSFHLVELATLAYYNDYRMEGKVPLAYTLAQNFSFMQTSAFQNTLANQVSPQASNATMVYNWQSKNNTHISIPIAKTESNSGITVDQLARNNYRQANMPGVPRTGSEIAAQRMDILQSRMNNLKRQPYGLEIFEVRQSIVRKEINNAITILKNSIKEISAEKQFTQMGDATSAWFKLTSLTLSIPELNTKLKETIGIIQTNTGGGEDAHVNLLFFPATSNQPDRTKVLNAAVKSFEKAAHNWLDNTREFDIQCANDTESFLSHNAADLVYGINSSDIYNEESWKFLQPLYEPANLQEHQQIINHPTYQKYLEIDKLLVVGNFLEARKLCSQIERGIDFSNICEIYKKKFFEKHTIEGVETRFINHPFYLTPKKQLDSLSNQNLPAPNEYNQFLEQTQKAYQLNINTLGITKKNPVIDTIVYGLTDLPKDSKSASSFIDSFGLSCDSSDPLKREAYHQLYSHGALKIFKVDSNLIEDMPYEIGMAQYQTERALLNTVIEHPISNEKELELTKKTVDYIKVGLQNTPEAHDYRILAHASAQALFNPSENLQVSFLAHYAQPMANVHHKQLQKAVVSIIAKNIRVLEGNIAGCEPRISKEVIHRIDTAYRALERGDIRAEYYLDNALERSINLNVLSVDYDAELQYFAGVNPKSVVATVQNRKDITKFLLKNGSQVELQVCKQSTVITDFLKEHGLNRKDYEQCLGNAMQQAIHQDILLQILKQHDLSGLQLLEESALHKLRDLTTKITDLSIDSIMCAARLAKRAGFEISAGR